jgi:hypothetical protein
MEEEDKSISVMGCEDHITGHPAVENGRRGNEHRTVSSLQKRAKQGSALPLQPQQKCKPSYPCSPPDMQNCKTKLCFNPPSLWQFVAAAIRKVDTQNKTELWNPIIARGSLEHMLVRTISGGL